MKLRENIRDFLKLELVNEPIAFNVQEHIVETGYIREKIIYQASDGDAIPAYLLIPDGEGPFPAVLAHHQHAGQRHLGKSEVIGLAGNPLQAFGPALARQGFIVLAPDSICFEDRRTQTSGIEPQGDDDHLQHYAEMGKRLAQGDTLMRKVLSDASTALSLLTHHTQVIAERIGVMGHSYGGTTALFQMALDNRISFGVSSGALGSYAHKLERDEPLEMALIIPNFATQWDYHHLLDCIAPRPLFVLSAEEDPYAKDAPDVIARTKSSDHVTHFCDVGGHEMTQERFDKIVDFVANCE